MKILIAILIFSILVLFHEFGHFITAKKLGIKVNEFWLGMGPTIFSFVKGETKYCLKAIWIGGACVMEDEENAQVNDSRAFNSAPRWKRALVVVAGPAFNMILAYIFGLIVILMIGVYKPTVGQVMANYPAERAGISEGDEILKLNGYRIHFFNEISVYNFLHPGEEIKVTYLHDGKRNTTTIIPQLDESGRYLIGISGGTEYTKLNIGEALLYGAYEVKYQIYTTIQSLGMLFNGRVSPTEVSGPVGIVNFVGDVYEESSQDGVFYVLVNMFNIITMLSANLGLMNLLPISALDGGKLLIYLFESIFRRELSEKLAVYINAAGFMVLLLLMIFATTSDIMKLF